MKNFICLTHFSKWKLKLKSRQPFKNDIPIVNIVEILCILERDTPKILCRVPLNLNVHAFLKTRLVGTGALLFYKNP